MIVAKWLVPCVGCSRPIVPGERNEGFIASEKHKDEVAMSGQPWRVDYPPNPYRSEADHG